MADDNSLQFFVRGVEVREVDDFISLNIFHEIAGSPPEQTPGDWKALPATDRFIKQVAKELNTEKSGILKSKRGKGGGTWGHWKIALAYAAYLDEALYSEILEVYKQVKTGDLAIASEVVRRNYDPEALKEFQKSVEEHQKYIDSYWGVHNQLKAHGANEGRQHAAYNKHVNDLAGVEKGKRHTADRAQVLKMRMMQDAGELELMGNEAQGWSAVSAAKGAGSRIMRALRGN